METETIKLIDETVITGFKNDLITNGLKASKNYYEFKMLDFIRKNIPKGVMMDCGANIGNHTIYLAKYCATQVIAFEPFPDTFELLETNILENKTKNVRWIKLGLSDENKELKMTTVSGNMGMNKIDSNGTIPVKVIRLDDFNRLFLLKFDSEPITLIKLDCEGYEEKALLGMMETIKKHQPALFIECQTEKELMAISKILLPLGYSNKQKFNATPTYLFQI